MNVLVPVGSLVTGTRIVLDALEVHHLRVRRAGAGEAIRLLDGATGALAPLEVMPVPGSGEPSPSNMPLALGPGWPVRRVPCICRCGYQS